MMSSIKMGMSSVTLLTPAAAVPSGAALLTDWPCCLACSSHFRVTLSTTYKTPSLWVAGAFLKWVKIF